MPHFNEEELARLSKGEVFYEDNPQLERTCLINNCSLLLSALKGAYKRINELEDIIEGKEVEN